MHENSHYGHTWSISKSIELCKKKRNKGLPPEGQRIESSGGDACSRLFFFFSFFVTVLLETFQSPEIAAAVQALLAFTLLSGVKSLHYLKLSCLLCEYVQEG